MKTSKLLFNIAYIITVVIGMALVLSVVVAGIMEIWKYDTEYIVKWMFTLLVLVVFMAFVVGVLLSKTEETVEGKPTEEILNNSITLDAIRKLAVEKIETNSANKTKIYNKLVSYRVERITELSTLDYNQFYKFLKQL